MSDLDTVKQNEILRSVVGSRLFGTNTETSDTDYMSVFVEPPELVFAKRGLETVNTRPRAEGEKSQAGDEEEVAYSLRHFVHLCMKGNPTAITLLWARKPQVVHETPVGASLRALAPHMVSRQCGAAFLGYMGDQKARLLGEKKGHIPRRPDIVDEHGYDTKYAMHVVRLALQGFELMKKHELQLPMEQEAVDLCRDIRAGRYEFGQIKSMVDGLEYLLAKAYENTDLPEEPDRDFVMKEVARMHFTHWGLDYV